MKRVVVLLLALCACGGSRRNALPPLSDLSGAALPLSRAALARELESDVLDGYGRDEPSGQPSRLLDASVGGARIGVGPDDIVVGFQRRVQGQRFPLQFEAPTRAEVWSKKLEVHIAEDGRAGWVSDELSWRITACGKTATVPLRFTGLYVREADRWVTVIEHLSYAQVPGERGRGDDHVDIEPATGPRDQALALDAAGAPLLAKKRPIQATISTDALVIGVDMWTELRGEEVRTQPLPAGAVTVVSRRVAALSSRTDLPTVGYWVGALKATTPAGLQIPLRATIVFERTDRWRVVQMHLSRAIDDDALAATVFGTAVSSSEPLQLDCERLLGTSTVL